ncbi:hypothetical protein GH714_004174 [Hevea brasiliensis]|uniref:Retrotransposon gag domain-containing protein n=1 Tax=Hevea brasiliensis TaxID=3981 RepID=A0A6A6NBD8_HEVBR|nr:hypothetical protein GH714_004174 [Hevea brasiliensis]
MKQRQRLHYRQKARQADEARQIHDQHQQEVQIPCCQQMPEQSASDTTDHAQEWINMDYSLLTSFLEFDNSFLSSWNWNSAFLSVENGRKLRYQITRMEKRVASMVLESERQQEARLQDMVAELKSLIAGLSKPDVEAVELVNRVEQGQIEGNVGNGGKPWGSTTKIEFPRFDGEELKGWLLRSKYFFEVGRIALENRVKVATLHLEGRAI